MSQNEQYDEAEDFRHALADSAVATQKRLADIHGPQWGARREVAKTILSLASGTLVLTVTFADKLAAKSAVAAGSTVLAWVWLILLVSIAGTLASLAFAVQLESLPARMISLQPKMFDKFKAARSAGEHPIRAFDPLMLEATKPLRPYDQASWWCLLAGLAAFFAGLSFLGYIGFTYLHQ